MTRALIINSMTVIMLCLLCAESASAHPAWGIVVDRQNQIYFSDLETIWRIDAEGKLKVFRPGVSGRHIHELALDEDGNIYGADYSYEAETQSYIEAIWKMTPDGGFAYIVAPTKSLQRGMSIWRDRYGNTYSVEQNNHLKRETLLLKREPGGNVTTLAGGSYGHADGKGSQAKFGSIVGMAFAPDGSLCLADGSSVRRVTMDGTVETLADGLDVRSADKNSVEGAAAWGSLMGLAVSAQNEVYVADYRNRRVLKISSGGAVSTAAQAEPTWSPTGVAVAKNGDLYILEVGAEASSANKPRVRKLSTDGKLTVVASVGENRNPSANENSSIADSERNVAPKSNAPYLLLFIAASIFVLMLVIWRVRRKFSSQPH